MNWNSFANKITVFVGLTTTTFFILGYAIGLEDGSPVSDITEIVWLETQNPIRLLDLECRMIPKENE